MDEKTELLWKDFLALGEKHKDNFTIPLFGSYLLTFTARMLADTAPNEQLRNTLILESIEHGILWSKKEKEGEKHD